MTTLDIRSLANSPSIVVRVAAKSGPRYKVMEINGELKITNIYFTMHLLTQAGEIHAMCFRKSVSRLIGVFEEGKLYEIRNFKIGDQSKKFWHPHNQFQLILTCLSKVQPLDDPLLALPPITLSKIADIKNLQHGEIVSKCSETQQLQKTPFDQPTFPFQTSWP